MSCNKENKYTLKIKYFKYMSVKGQLKFYILTFKLFDLLKME